MLLPSVHRLISSLSSLSRPVLVRFVLSKVKTTTRLTHSTVFVNTAGQNRGTMSKRRPFERLPTDVYPVNYGLCLKPDLIDFTFEGKVEALVEVSVPKRLPAYMDVFVVHAAILLCNLDS